MEQQQGTPDKRYQDINEADAFLKEVIDKHVQINEDGKRIIKDDVELDPFQKLAVKSELRRRDTESSYTRVSQELAKVRAKTEALEGMVKVEPTISEDEEERLETLKFENPELWYNERKRLEAEAEAIAKSTRETRLKDVDVQANAKLRDTVIAEFNSTHPDTPITEEILQYDIPPRYMKNVEEGKMTYNELLEQVHTIVYGKKQVTPSVVFKREDPEDNIDLYNAQESLLVGAVTPESAIASYTNTNF